MSKCDLIVGTVPYLNACPLVDWFHFDGAGGGVTVVDAVPSELAMLIDRRKVGIGLVSTLQAIMEPTFSTVPDIGVAATGAVESVRLFSKCPIASIDSIALDESSNTSNVLLQILMQKVYGKSCAYSHHPPDLKSMTANADAALLIGDNGYEEIVNYPYVYDLGQEWFDFTGLPFVYAVWTSKDAISSELSNLVHQACAWGTRHLDFIATERANKHRTSVTRAQHYFNEVMQYRLNSSHTAGLAAYSDFVRELSTTLVFHQR